MVLYIISGYDKYPDLVSLNPVFYSRFQEDSNEYNKEWTLFDVLYLLGIYSLDSTTLNRILFSNFHIKSDLEILGIYSPYFYQNISNNFKKGKLSGIIENINATLLLEKLNNLNDIYDRLVLLNRAPNSYPFNINKFSKYLIVSSLGGDITTNAIPDNRRGAFYMLTPENYNTNEIYERMSRELNNGTLYPESTDVLFRYRSRIVLDLAPESNFSFGGNINIYEINIINNLPKNRINTNLFYLAFLIGKYFDTDRFFRQFPIKNKLISYDPENVYTWIPQNIAMMIAHRRDIRSNLRLSVHELLKLEDEKDVSYINNIKSGQINNEHMEEILLYFALLGNDVEALSFLNMMDLQKILKLYVNLPSLKLNKEVNRINTTETVILDKENYGETEIVRSNKENYRQTEIYYQSLINNIRPILNIKETDEFSSKIIGYSILVNYYIYKELLGIDYSILRSIYILKGCPTKTALLTDKMGTLIGLLTGQFYPIKDYSNRSYLTNYLSLINERMTESPIMGTIFPRYNSSIDCREYYLYSIIANYSPDIIKGLIEVNTNNVDSLTRLFGISLEFLNYLNINPNNLPDHKVRNFRNTIVTMAFYFDRPSDEPELSLINVKNVEIKTYNDFELLALFNLHPTYNRDDLLYIYSFINTKKLLSRDSIPFLPIILRDESPNTTHFLNTDNLTIIEEPINNYNNKINAIKTEIENSIFPNYSFEQYLTSYEEIRNRLFPNNLVGNN